MVSTAFVFHFKRWPTMSSPTVIAIAADHGGVDLKSVLAAELARLGHSVIDLGTNGSVSVDYPDYAAALAETIREGRVKLGVLLCGTGIGISIAANRYPWIRAALIHDAFGARLARQHNDANVIAMGGRTMGPELAKDCLRVFLDAQFEGGRHARRVEKMSGTLPVSGEPVG
jgi:ribose 5-phosphate isomerase B